MCLSKQESLFSCAHTKYKREIYIFEIEYVLCARFPLSQAQREAHVHTYATATKLILSYIHIHFGKLPLRMFRIKG